jgi:hypothetical protein
MNANGVNGANGDPDRDNLVNSAEFAAHTNPNNFDTDGDGLNDGFEVQKGLNPLSSPGQSEADVDTDGDGLSDPLEYLFFGDLSQTSTNDFDGDGLSNGEECRVVGGYDNPIGVASEWIETPPNANEINWDDNDEGFSELPIGFSFPFYGSAYSNLHVSVNGIVSFGAEYGVWDEVAPMPTGAPFAAIAPFWADLQVISGSVHYYAVGSAPERRFVIAWERVSFWDEPSTSFSFQMELCEDGWILFRYGQMDGGGITGMPMAVGLQNSNGVDGSLWRYENDAPGGITNGLAVLFTRTRTKTLFLRSYPNNSDSDGDGMPDGWEIQYGFNPLFYADGGFDRDGDGLLNRDEYLSGTDPDGVLQAASLDVFNVIFYQPTRF